ncbi:hypothetical protein SVAN01_03033 [Stagonosporopsis vannaccii]|nr:hypothetical protein SVAN01_03033 [Stagonosporopsis vannaccii]
MNGNTEVAATAWLTELDGIDIFWNNTTFAHSHLGRLPPELLDSIVKHIPTSDLPAAARISPRLRELAERCLYTCIDLNDEGNGFWTSPPRNDSLWILYCTLNRRSDLAQAIKRFSVTLFDTEVSINTDTSALFPGDTQLSSAAKVSLQHILIGGRMLQHLTDVESLAIHINKSASNGCPWSLVDTGGYKEMAPSPLAHLLSPFHHAAAHTFQLPGLQNLTHFEFGGAEFHWALAKSPGLRKLCLTRPCVILADRAPDEVNTSLKMLEMTARSTILRKKSHRYASFSSFLAHFPSMEGLTVRIFDLAVDKLPNSPDRLDDEGELDYTNLLDKISAVATHLNELDIGVYTVAEDVNGVANDYLRQVHPGHGFQEFKVLRSLVVPYQCLLGHTFSSVDTLPSPAALLPSNLEFLDIHCPQIHLYDWLARLDIVQHRLPELSSILLYCQSPHGDDYDVFEFVHNDHHVMEILSRIGIELHLDYRDRDWKKEWDDYDLKILEAIEWLDGL